MIAGAVEQVAPVNAHGVLIADALADKLRNPVLGQKSAGHRIKGVEPRGDVDAGADVQAAHLLSFLIEGDGLGGLVNQQAIAMMGLDDFQLFVRHIACDPVAVPVAGSPDLGIAVRPDFQDFKPGGLPVDHAQGRGFVAGLGINPLVLHGADVQHCHRGHHGGPDRLVRQLLRQKQAGRGGGEPGLFIKRIRQGKGAHKRLLGSALHGKGKHVVPGRCRLAADGLVPAVAVGQAVLVVIAAAEEGGVQILRPIQGHLQTARPA